MLTLSIMNTSKILFVRHKQGFTLVELLVVIAIIASLAAISAPIMLREIARSRATQALNNGKDIYAGIRDHAFQNSGRSVTRGSESTSSGIFTNLFDAGFIRDEKSFFVRGFPGKVEGNGDGMLETDENCFSVFVDQSSGEGVNIQNAPPNAPLLASPFGDASGTLVDSRWNFSAYGGLCVVVYWDGAAIAYNLNQLDQASEGSGVILDPDTSMPIDGTHPPTSSPLVSIEP